MKIQNYECAKCHGREYHCFTYINELADSEICLGEMCPIMMLRTKLDLRKESKRLGLEDIDSLAKLESCADVKVFGINSLFLSPDTYDDGGY